MGENNVFVISSTSFKSKTSCDNAYFYQFSPSLVIADSSIMYAYLYILLTHLSMTFTNRPKSRYPLTSLPIARDFRESMSKLMELKYMTI